MSELSELRAEIDRADSAYYRLGHQPLMTDGHYDQLKHRLRTLAPDDPRHTRVGVPYQPHELGTKTQLSIPMGSLDNLKQEILGLPEWVDKLNSKLPEPSAWAISHKLDGVSVVADYDDRGVLIRVVSRGNGTVGEEITANAALFQGLPHTLPVPLACSVRGEVLLHRADFDRLMEGRTPDQISNPRNTGSGIVGRDNGQDCELLRFYTFNLVGPQGRLPWLLPDGSSTGTLDSEAEKFCYLRDVLGFQTAPVVILHQAQEIADYYYRILAARPQLPYDIDGLVITANLLDDQQRFITADLRTRLKPKYARALKFPQYSAETELTAVTVTVGHTGAIIPTAQLARVRVGGVWVENALLNNYDEIQRLGLAVGDRVQVILAGDIIPKLIAQVQPGPARQPIPEPASCPSCGAPTSRQSRGKEGANLYCTGQDCPAVAIGKIDAYIGSSKKGVGILDVGDQMIKALYDQRLVRDPADLYALRPEVVAEVRLDSGGRIGLSRAQRLVDNIQAKRQLPLNLFLGSLGIELLGRRRVQLLAEAAQGQLDRLEDWLDDQKLAQIQLRGLGSEMRTAFRQGIDRLRPLIQKFLDQGVVVQPLCSGCGAEEQQQEVLPLTGISMCFTGTRECIKEVEALGGKIDDGVRQGTTFLVQKDAAQVTSKSKKAQQVGTRILALEQLKQLLADQDYGPLRAGA